MIPEPAPRVRTCDAQGLPLAGQGDVLCMEDNELRPDCPPDCPNWVVPQAWPAGIPAGLLDPDPADNPARAGTKAALRAGAVWVELDGIPGRHLARLEAPPVDDGRALRGEFRLVRPIYFALDGWPPDDTVYPVPVAGPTTSRSTALFLAEHGPAFVTQRQIRDEVYPPNTIQQIGIGIALAHHKPGRTIDGDRLLWFLESNRAADSSLGPLPIAEVLANVIAAIETGEYDLGGACRTEGSA